MVLFTCLALVSKRSIGRNLGVTAFASFSFSGTYTAASKTFLGKQHPHCFQKCSNNLSTITSLKSSVASETSQESVDKIHPAFEVVSKDFVKEYGSDCTIYRHRKTGAELLSVKNDDDNKVFGITFRTPPSDSTGVAHILEHSVLCGSKKYKTKEPFVQLLQGSLQTFLNAFTYPDRTCYVLASQNTKDFYNMINVYTDAVFNPRAVSDPRVHAQEGWHFELEDKNQPLTYKGVVYNEMKGVYSSPDSIMMRDAQQALFPENTYGVDSGGSPVDIPNLSFEQFVEFHSKFYHPANSRIFFWGDDNVNDRLKIMDEYLSEFESSPTSKVSSQIEWQKKVFSEPRWAKYPYPIGADQPETHMVMVEWLMNDSDFSPAEELTAGILDHLLMGTAQSILYKTLIESGLGAETVGGGLSDELLQATFSAGLKGVKPEDSKEVENLVLRTLQTVSEDGFADDDIAAAMNTIEFRLREFNTGSFPKGLSFMLGAMSKWIYGGSPTEALKFEEPLRELKAKITESGSEVFKDFVRDYLVNNSHRLTIEMVPSATMEEEEIKREEDLLATIKASFDDSQLDKIIQDTTELKAFQATEDSSEARSTIPSLELSDLKREVTEYPIDVSENEDESGVTVLRHELSSTAGIVYVNFGIDVSRIPFEDLPLLKLFTRIMTQTGAGEYSDVDLSRMIGTHTGGVSANFSLRTVNSDSIAQGVVNDSEHMISKIFITGKATSDKVAELFSIFNLILTDANLDSKKKVIEMLKETKSGLQSSIQNSGHSYSNTRMKARYSISSYLSEKIGGITSLEIIDALLKEAEEDWDSVLNRMKNIRNIMLDNDTSRSGMLLDLTGDSDVLTAIQPEVKAFLKQLPGDCNGAKLQNFYDTPHPWATIAKGEMSSGNLLKNEGFVVPTQVSYVGKALRLYENGEKVPGSTSVVSRFLRTGYLWDHVRVIGGAYGGMCSFSAKDNDGVFTFVSYRDPNLDQTLDVYDGAADALLEAAELLERDEKELATALIGAVGDMDGALSPDQKGNVAFNRWISRESPEERQKFRDEVLNTKPSDFKDFAMRLKALKQPSVAVVSSSSAFDSSTKEIEVNQVL